MTEGRAHFVVEPWSVTAIGLDLASLGVNESVFGYDLAKQLGASPICVRCGEAVG